MLTSLLAGATLAAAHVAPAGAAAPRALVIAELSSDAETTEFVARFHSSWLPKHVVPPEGFPHVVDGSSLKGGRAGTRVLVIGICPKAAPELQETRDLLELVFPGTEVRELAEPTQLNCPRRLRVPVGKVALPQRGVYRFEGHPTLRLAVHAWSGALPEGNGELRNVPNVALRLVCGGRDLVDELLFTGIYRPGTSDPDLGDEPGELDVSRAGGVTTIGGLPFVAIERESVGDTSPFTEESLYGVIGGRVTKALELRAHPSSVPISAELAIVRPRAGAPERLEVTVGSDVQEYGGTVVRTYELDPSKGFRLLSEEQRSGNVPGAPP